MELDSATLSDPLARAPAGASPARAASNLRLHLGALVAVLGLVLGVALLHAPAQPFTQPGTFLTLHTIMELFSIVVSMLVFVAGWNNLSPERARNMLVLACAFLSVGLIDVAHTLSYPGMPAFFTPNSPEKAIDFWLAARLAAAGGMLAAALLSWRPFARRRAPYALLAGAVALTVLAYWIGLGEKKLLPHTFVAGRGLTSFKIACEWGLALANALAAALFYRRSRRDHAEIFLYLCAAGAVTAWGELFFTLFQSTTDLYNFLGHAYKVVAYWLIYRAVYAYGARSPFEALRRARAELELSTLRFSHLTELSSDWYWEQDAELRFTFLSPGAGDNAGYDAQRYLGKERWELPWLDFPAEKWREHRALLEARQPFRDFVLKTRADDGSLRYLSISGAPVFDERGTFKGYRGVGRNVTERVRAEQELRKLSQAIEQSPMSVLITDRHARIEYVNPRFTELSGWSAQEAIGRTPRGLKHPETPDSVFDEMQAAVLAGRPWRGEMYSRRKNGEPYWQHLNIAPLLDPCGEITHFIAIEEDVTARKEAERALRETEQQFAQLAENIPEVFWLFDVAQRRYVYVSPSCEKSWGIARERLEADPQAFLTAVHAEDRPHVRAFLAAPDAPVLRFRIVAPRGQVRWVQTSVMPLRDCAGNVYRYAGVASDVTEQRQDHLRKALGREAARHFAEASTEGGALRSILRVSAESFGWELALYWARDAQDGLLHCAQTWTAADQAVPFLEDSRARAFACDETTFLGHVCSKHAPVWIPELAQVTLCVRLEPAVASGLRSAMAYPVLDGREVVGVMEFFSRFPKPIDESFARVAAQLGRQIGQQLGRRRAEVQLRESRERLQGIVDSALDAIITIDDAQRIVLFNPEAERIFRCTAAEALGATLDRFIPERFRAAHAGYLRHFAARQQSPRPMGPARLVTGLRADGEEFPAEATIARIVRDGDVLLTVMLRDVTERLRTEAQLRASEAQLRMITDNVPGTITYFDGEWRCRFANAAFAAQFGVPSRDLTGRHIREILPAPEYERLAPRFEEVFEGHSVKYDRVHTAPDGSQRHLEVTMIPDRSESGAVQGWYGFASDVTQRKLAEDTLRREREFVRQVLDTDPNLIYVKDAAGRFALLNRGMEQLLDSLDAREPQPAAPDEVEREVLRSRRPVVVDEIFTRADAKVFWYHTVKTPLEMPDGTVHVLSIGTDITERKRVEDEVRRLNAELEQRVAARTRELEAANRELESFSYSVSHDLRAPLRGIEGFSQLLAKQHAAQLDATGRDFLQRIRAASLRMSELIDDLLNLSRLSRKAARRVRTDLSDMVREVAAQLAGESPGRAVELEVQDDVRAVGDPRLLRVALENLLANAWKFTARQARPRVAFGCAGEGAEAVYFVRDNGVGFDMKYADKLFRAFQRLHSSSDFEGTGIGLATVQRVVQAHGGRIWVEARPGEGATFFFTLPGQGRA